MCLSTKLFVCLSVCLSVCLWLGARLRGLSLWERRAAQSRQARPEEAQEPSSGTAYGEGTVGASNVHAAPPLVGSFDVRYSSIR